MSGYATQNLSGVSKEYKDLVKFVEDTNSHLFGEELKDSLNKAKGRHYSCRHLNLRETTLIP